jgi:S-DNA-T family DNA segregation ATPase FtsK/SpoIIIE
VKQVQELQNIFNELNVKANVVNKTVGCRITTYEYVMHKGVLPPASMTRILSTIQVRLGAETIRSIKIPQNNTFGIEVPSRITTPVKIGDVVRSDEYKQSDKKFKFVVGKTPRDEVIIDSIPDARNILIGGCQGSGKSVFENILILSLLNESPEDLKMIMIDPKMVELSSYEGLPHLLAPVLTDTREIENALKWVLDTAKARYDKIRGLAAYNKVTIRNIDEFNDKILTYGTPEEIREHKMARIVVVIDELTQLLMTPESVCRMGFKHGGAVMENIITQTIQFTRAAGVNIIAATQNPKAEVINTLMRDNFSTRVAFKTTTASASRIILDEPGGEILLGSGDMLYKTESNPNTLRLQGAYVSSDEIDRAVTRIKELNAPVRYDESAMWSIGGGDEVKELLERSKKDGTYERTFQIFVDSGHIVTNGNNWRWATFSEVVDGAMADKAAGKR